MQKSLFGKYLRVTMVIVLASFIVLGSVMMFVFSQYTKSDKRKLLMQNASSMASITSVVDITNNGAPELLKVFVRTFSLNIDADIFVTDLEGNVLFGAYANSTSNIGANFIPQTKISADIVKCASEGSYTGDGRKNGITIPRTTSSACRFIPSPKHHLPRQEAKTAPECPSVPFLPP